jgi:hypothetical protein
MHPAALCESCLWTIAARELFMMQAVEMQFKGNYETSRTQLECNDGEPADKASTSASSSAPFVTVTNPTVSNATVERSVWDILQVLFSFDLHNVVEVRIELCACTALVGCAAFGCGCLAVSLSPSRRGRCRHFMGQLRFLGDCVRRL